MQALQTFLAIVESGSFRAAADRLGVTQPTVSARLQQLEAALKTRLFDRTTRRVELTRSGERLHERATALVRDMAGLATEFQDEAALQRGRIRVLVSPSLAAVVAPDWVTEFTQRYPGIQIELREDIIPGVTRSLIAGEADFALVSEAIEQPGIRFEHLFWDPFLVLAPRGHALERKSRPTLSDVAAFPVINLADSGVGTTMQRHFEAAGLRPHVNVQCSNLLTLVKLVEAGAGLLLVPELLLGCVDLNRVAVLRMDQMPAPRAVGLAFRRGRSLPPAARAMVRTLQSTWRERGAVRGAAGA